MTDTFELAQRLGYAEGRVRFLEAQARYLKGELDVARDRVRALKRENKRVRRKPD